MKLTNSEVIKRFIGGENGKSGHMFISGDVLYSYGYHFPLLVRMRNWGKDKFLLNADKYSVTTSSHQSSCFEYATVQIPFSALQRAFRAGISRLVDDILLAGKVSLVDYYNSHEALEWDYVHKKTGKRISQDLYDFLSVKQISVCDEYKKEYRPETCVLKYSRHGDDEYYLSSMENYNYFLTMLPHKVATIKEAFDSLVPPIVKKRKYSYKRQGEWFFVPVNNLSKKTKHVMKKDIVKQTHLNGKYDRNHMVRDWVSIGKSVLVRGTVRHRNGDHKMLKLGETWHLAVESTHLGSWTVDGQID